MISGYQNRALQTRLKIPLIYGIDAVHGNNNVPGATIYPHNIGLGATSRCGAGAPDRSSHGRARPKPSAPTLTFAPCVTVPQGRALGAAPTKATRQETRRRARLWRGVDPRFCRATDLAAPSSIFGVRQTFYWRRRHDLRTSQKNGFGLDQGDTRISEAQLRAVFLPPYRGGRRGRRRQRDAGRIRVFNGRQMFGLRRFLLTDLLKNELGFQGIVFVGFRRSGTARPRLQNQYCHFGQCRYGFDYGVGALSGDPTTIYWRWRAKAACPPPASTTR